MRTVVAGLIATVYLLASLPGAAAPPEDVAAYCRATYPQVQFQVRCLNVEHAAAARVSRASAGADPGVFNHCLSVTASWASMEACLAEAARGVPASAPPPIPPATTILGPRPGAPLAAPAPRPSQPIPEADADRHLRGILERTGTLDAQCRKKQYGPGWVTICEDARSADRGRPEVSPPVDDRLGL